VVGDTGYVDDQGKNPTTGASSIGLGRPKLAPYGAAAVEVLKGLFLQDKLTLLVLGENIPNHQFVTPATAN
jgi:molybdate transport system substrate-binding protein